MLITFIFNVFIINNILSIYLYCTVKIILFTFPVDLYLKTLLEVDRLSVTAICVKINVSAALSRVLRTDMHLAVVSTVYI